MVVHSLGVTEEEIPLDASVFTDVTVEWQVKYIMYAYNFGIVHGYRVDGQPTWTFGPENSLTRAEACKLTVEARDI